MMIRIVAVTAWLFLLVAPSSARSDAESSATGKTDQPSERPALFEATSRHSFEDVSRWISVFDDPARAEWQMPARVVKALGLHPGWRVADLGAGTGYFSRHLAAAVGESGTVLAVEVEPNLVIHLRERAEAEKTDNVVPVLASPDNPRLPYASMHLVLLVNTFHHIDNRLTYFQKLRHSLAADGRVAIIDWRKRELPVGPPLSRKLARPQAIEEMKAAGYQLAKVLDFLPYQYFLLFSVEPD
jgi:ubiquinone/menaquinone biosynthesis C-methylase UbiE